MVAAVKQQDDRSHSSAPRLRLSPSADWNKRSLREISALGVWAALIRWKQTASEALQDKSVPQAPEARGALSSVLEKGVVSFQATAVRERSTEQHFFFKFLFIKIHFVDLVNIHSVKKRIAQLNMTRPWCRKRFPCFYLSIFFFNFIFFKWTNRLICF